MSLFYLPAAVLVLVALYTLYLNTLATLVVARCDTLGPFQRLSQTAFVWLVPLVGACLILHLAFSIAPNILSKALIPWPFKNLI